MLGAEAGQGAGVAVGRARPAQERDEQNLPMPDAALDWKEAFAPRVILPMSLVVQKLCELRQRLGGVAAPGRGVHHQLPGAVRGGGLRVI